jgi:ABC-type multidrug transport system ATPase subunit
MIGTRIAGLRVEADSLVQLVRGGRRVLDEVSLVVEPGQLVAVIGSSGAGKSLLLEALAGVRRPSAGAIRYDGATLRPGEPAPGVIGFVPQDDIVHHELPLVSMLRYAARLRLPSVIGRNDLRARVDGVLTALGLSDQALVRVGSLSGGERKRAGIGVELLTRPRAFFLDEPTSGLDPLTASSLVQHLRGLADNGVTVVLTTHNAADVDLCDHVAVLGPAGRLAFSGSPEQARIHFGVATIQEVYLALATLPESSARSTASPTASPTTASAEPGSVPARPIPAGPAGRADQAGRTIGPVRQCLVLARRTAQQLTHNRLTLGILLGSPLIVLAMFLMLFRAGAFDPATGSPSTAVMILFWIAFGGFFFGLTYGLLQVCTEWPIVRREWTAGVGLGPYLISKVVVLLPLLAVIDLVLLALLRGLDRLPAVGAQDFSVLYLTLLLATAAALALGLLCSAAVSDPAQAALALPMLCFPQVLFVGAILPVPVMAPVGRWLSFAMSNRWSFEGLGHTAGVAALWQHGSSPLGPPLLASYGDSFARPIGQNWIILTGFTVFFLLAGRAVLQYRCQAGRRG